MNSFMNIQIRVLSAQALARLKAVEAQMAGLQTQIVRANTAARSMSYGIPGMAKIGNQVQWAGRQLQYNFTLPIVLAGAAATKFALDNERAMTRVKKVYGDNSELFNRLAQKELPALEDAFEALSNKFGQTRSDVINIAADWAAAGASGLALAKSVELTLETMILGELEAKEATEALIAIQAQYGESIKDLSRTIDTLNMIENQTGIQMQGLIQGFARAAGAARSAGIDVQHLGAMLAALVPAAGNAERAGNALKTIISRVMAPTKEAAEVMGLMGINVKELGWQSLNGMQRIEAMAESFVKLDDAQKAVVSSVVASRWQINRFDVLMRDIVNPVGYYQRSLESTSDATRNYTQRVKELNAVLDSNPQKMKQVWVILQNGLANAIQPLLPTILGLAGSLARLAQSFSQLDPATQKFIAFSLLALAAIGPLMRYIGSLTTLVSYLSFAFHFAGAKVLGFGKIIKKGLIYPLLLAQTALRMFSVALAVNTAQDALIATTKMKGFQKQVAKFAIYLGTAAKAVRSGIGTIFGFFGTALAGAQAALIRGLAAIPGIVAGTLTAMRPALYAFMSRFWLVLGLSGAILDKILSTVYVFMAVTVPQAIARAYRPIFAASVRVWMAISAALMASGTAIVSAVGTAWEMLTAFIARTYTAIYTAAAAAFSAINAALVSAFVAVRRTLLMLPALMMWGLRMTGVALMAGMARLVALFQAGMAMFPVIAAKTWGLVIASAKILSKLGPAILAALTSPWTYAILAVVGILYAFKDQLASIWKNIQTNAMEWLEPLAKGWASVVQFMSDIFWKLPESVRDAIMTVVKIIQTAAMKVYEWFSYLNPFAKHSPSLVDQVIAGMAIIRREYASVGNVGSSFSKAASDLARFKKAVSGLGITPFMDERSSVAAVFPKMLGMFDTLVADLGQLNVKLGQQAALVDRQQAVVDKWKLKLDQANAAVDGERAKLEALEKQLNSLTEAYSAHEQAMQDYASAPLKGMGAMSDAIFANEMAQKELRLEMLKWEQANGSFQDIQSTMALLAGDIERLKGEAQSLQREGAGSDILGPINAQIAEMQDAYAAMSSEIAASPINEMQKELDKLSLEGEILDLENSINFDPMLREIEKLANAQQELAYSDIINGINAERAAMAELQPQIDSVTAAVKAQQASVDAVTAARDQLQARYDQEYAKLSMLQDQYRVTETLVRDIESALRDLASAADEASARAAEAGRSAQSALSPGAENFLAAAGGNFPEVGSDQQIGREGGFGDQSADIERFTRGIEAEIAASFGDMDLFAPVKEKWNAFTQWLQDNVWSKLGPVWESVKTGFSDAWDALANSSGGQALVSVWNTIKDAFSSTVDFLRGLWDLFKDDFKHIIDVIVEKGKEAWNKIGPELAKFGPVLQKFGKLWEAIWPIIKVVAGIIGGALVAAFKLVTSILSHTLGPALDVIIAIISTLIGVARGFIDFWVSIFTGDFQGAVDAIYGIGETLVNGIIDIFKGLWDTVYGIFEGLINGIIDIWNWLYDILVGHSIIPDMVNAIIDWFKKLPGKAWDALISLKDKVVDVAKQAWNAMQKKSEELWSDFTTWVKSLPQKAYDALIDIREKLKTLGGAAFQWLWDKAQEKWESITTWVKSLPQKAYDSFKLLIDKLKYLGGAAFTALWDKMKEIFGDNKGGILGWVKSLPQKIADGMKSIGSKVASAIKNAWNAAAGWINDNGIAAVNKVTTKFGFELSPLPKFAQGGVIGRGISQKDDTLIMARRGEGVIVPELVRALGGRRGLDAANKAAQTGSATAMAKLGVPGYADGGIIGKVTGWLQNGAGAALSAILGATKGPIRSLIPGRPFAEDWLIGQITSWQEAAKKWGDQKEAMGEGVLPGRDWHWQAQALHKQFPGAVITSSYRPNAVTATGYTSMHALGRAIDIEPRDAIFEWIRSTYGKNTKELIYSPKGAKQILNGRDYNYGEPTRSDHWDHIHWGYDKGGILPPGLTFARNNTGRDEVTLTAEQWRSFSNVVSLMDTITQKSAMAGTPGAAAVARVGARLASVESRLGSTSTYPTRGGGDTFNFYGDLEFPNITDGEDAEEFINNLKGLVAD